MPVYANISIDIWFRQFAHLAWLFTQEVCKISYYWVPHIVKWNYVPFEFCMAKFWTVVCQIGGFFVVRKGFINVCGISCRNVYI